MSDLEEISIVGGGFYGCFLGLHFAKKGHSVHIYEENVDLMLGASNINQYKIHNGYHYPRDPKTAATSRKNYGRFIHEFSEAVYRDFVQYYAVAKGSKTSAAEFAETFSKTNLVEDCTSLFPHKTEGLEAIFRVDEMSFDAHKLRDIMKARLKKAGAHIHLNSRISEPEQLKGRVFVCTYSSINSVLREKLDLVYKRTEMLYFQVGPEFKHIGLTVMDGPYFSFTPAPGRGCHVLSCVHLGVHEKDTNVKEIREYVSSFLPYLKECHYKGSNFHTKALLPSTMDTDGRPVFIKKVSDKVTLVIGSKIDNVYDMIEELEGVQSARYILSKT